MLKLWMRGRLAILGVGTAKGAQRRLGSTLCCSTVHIVRLCAASFLGFLKTWKIVGVLYQYQQGTVVVPRT